MFALDSRFGWFNGWLVAHPNDIAKPCGRLQLLIFASETLKIREMPGATERFGMKGKVWQWDLITRRKSFAIGKVFFKSFPTSLGFRIRWKCSKSLILKVCNIKVPQHPSINSLNSSRSRFEYSPEIRNNGTCSLVVPRIAIIYWYCTLRRKRIADCKLDASNLIFGARFAFAFLKMSWIALRRLIE